MTERDATDRETPPCRSLADVAVGERVVVHRVGGGCRLAGRMAALGILPGVTVEIVRHGGRGPFVIAVRGSQLALGRGVAHKILVSG